MVGRITVQAAKGAALLFDPGQGAHALLAGEHRSLDRYRVFRAQHFVLALEKRAELGQQTGLFGEHLRKVLAADITVER
jgi:hypothetical protein